MADLEGMAERVLVRLNDSGESTWDVDTISQFITDGLNQLNVFLWREVTDTLDTTQGDNEVPLPEDWRGMVEVNWDGVDLKQMNRLSPTFTLYSDRYDIIPGDGETAPIMVLSKTPTATETDIITVRYMAPHVLDESNNTLLPEYEECLILYAIWQAFVWLASREMQTPTSASALLMGQLSSNAGRAERDWRRSLVAIMANRVQTTITPGWHMDKWDV